MVCFISNTHSMLEDHAAHQLGLAEEKRYFYYLLTLDVSFSIHPDITYTKGADSPLNGHTPCFHRLKASPPKSGRKLQNGQPTWSI